MSEVWRPVVGYERHYEVSSDGAVRSVDRVLDKSDGTRQPRRGQLLTPTPSGKGYLSVMLRFAKRRYVHSLVCEAFHGPRPSDSHEAAHGNGDRLDNRASNLRWATKPENQQDSIRHGTKWSHPIGTQRATDNPNAKLTWDIVREMRRRHADGESERRLAAEFGIGKSQAHNVLSGKSWQERG